MARFCELLQNLGISVGLQNPYRHRTKGEMVRECSDRNFLEKEAKNTMSCSSEAKARWSGSGPMHCGHCVPCIIRRASLMAGLGHDDTTYVLGDLTARALDPTKAEGSHIRSFQLALARLSRKPGRAHFDIHRPGPLNDYPNDIPAYERVYVHGLQEVGKLLAGVKVSAK
jgi:hypothetical protein